MTKNLFILIAFIVALTTQSLGQCFSSSNTFVYTNNGSKYVIVKEYKSWTAAAACAKKSGGHLVHIESAQEQKMLMDSILYGAKIAKNYKVTTDGTYVWIGATDKQSRDQWHWDGDDDGRGTLFWQGTNTGTPYKNAYYNWGGRGASSLQEPDGWGVGGDYGGMALNTFGTGAAGEWNDLLNSHTFFYVIEMPCKSVTNVIDTTICSQDSIIVNGRYLKGSYSGTDTLKGATDQKCDSIIRISLRIEREHFSYDVNLCSGDSFYLRNRYVKTAGKYFDTTTSTKGCKQYEVYYVETNENSAVSNQEKYLCPGDSIRLGQKYRYSSGLYIDTLLNNTGCDSIVKTTLSLAKQYDTALDVHICQGDSLFLEGMFQKKGGLYTEVLPTVFGCDSVINTNLYIEEAKSSISNVYMCEGDSLRIGGAFRYNSGRFKDTLASIYGCDSIVTRWLFTKTKSQTENELSICQGESVLLENKEQTESGVYYDTFSNVNGCDSVVITTLSVEEFDLGIVKTKNILTVNEPNASYQWLDCENDMSTITGEIKRSIEIDVTSSLAVEIYSELCRDTSDCVSIDYVGLNDIIEHEILFYPNPSKGQLWINFPSLLVNADISITNAKGQIIRQMKLDESSPMQVLRNGTPAGFYVIRIITSGESLSRRILLTE